MLLIGGCYSEGVCFTSGATEANNIVLGPIHCDMGTTLLVSSVEHASVLRPAEQARRRGCDVRILPVDGSGLIDPEAVRVEAGSARERLVVSIQWANSETGIVQALAEIAREVRLARETFFHSDAVQALGRVPVDLAAVDVDAISVTAHKMHGPQGIGALIMRDRDEKVPPPLMFGETIRRASAPERSRSSLPLASDSRQANGREASTFMRPSFCPCGTFSNLQLKE